jgi:hypothetical protein
MLTATAARSLAADGAPAAPDHEKRSCIKAVDGYAYLAEDKTISQIRDKAFLNAKRKAVEAARTYIRSKTVVKDGRMQYDLVWSGAEGEVNVLEQKDYGIEDNNRYHVWIKAEVFYSLTPKITTGEDPPDITESGPLTVSVWTGKKVYSAGEGFAVFLKGNRNFYATVVNRTSAGDMIKLLPNDYRRDNFFEGGKVYRIPDDKDRFDLIVSPPYGEDRIIVYASETPVGRVDVDTIGKGLGIFRGSREELDQKVRAITVEGRASEFYEASWSFLTQNR